MMFAHWVNRYSAAIFLVFISFPLVRLGFTLVVFQACFADTVNSLGFLCLPGIEGLRPTSLVACPCNGVLSGYHSVAV